MDFGCRLRGYCSDITRTVCLGEIPSRLQEVYTAVLEAMLKAEREIRPGMTGRQADAIARDYLAERGLAEYFTHGLGHGIGLAEHEPPRLSRLSEQVLQPGMVFSVEPGVYILGWGGVRIEDLVVLREDGPEVLTRSPRFLSARDTVTALEV